MSDPRKTPFFPPIYHGDQDEEVWADKPEPLNHGTASNRGRRAREGSGVVEGSGAAAGGGGNPEDYDSDSAGGGRAEPIPPASRGRRE